MADTRVFDRLRSFPDYMKAEEEFKLKKQQGLQQGQLNQLKIQQAQQELNQPKLPFEGTSFDAQIANEAYRFNLSKGMDEATARQKAVDMTLGSKVDYSPVTDPYTGQTSLVPRPRKGIFGGQAMPQAATPTYSGQPMQPDMDAQLNSLGGAMQAPVSMPPMPQQEMPQPSMQSSMPNIDPRALQSPDVQMDLARDLTKMNYQDQLRIADETLKSQEGKGKVAGIIKRMQEINEQLRSKNAIVSSEQDLPGRAKSALETTWAGQAARKVTDPESQALADEYTKLQATLLPFFAKASGLGAKSLDSEGERKSIMGSFGDPSGIYETNVKQLKNLEQLFDVQGSQQSDPLGLFE